MDRLDYWRLCTDFTVVQAALIACGIAPEEMQWDVERWAESECPPGYVAIKTALMNGLASGRIKPSRASFHYDEQGEETRRFDIHSTTIAIEEIDRFLKSKGVVSVFFDRAAVSAAAENETAVQMPPKLSAALKAWSAVSSDPTRLRGRSPKQALEQWLLEHAAELRLTNADGKPNRTGIEEICKVANWKPSGGAPATPVGEQSTIATEQPARPLLRLPTPAAVMPGQLVPRTSRDTDDEIPF